MVTKWILLMALLACALSCTTQNMGYKLDWKDDFNGDKLNTDNWVFSSWDPMCTNNNFVTYVKKGKLFLKAMKNPDTNDTIRKYVAGCIETKNKRHFLYGKMEVKARFNQMQGGWSAIWMKPVDGKVHKGWPTCGEIDIMEHLNSDPYIHITVHSYDRMNNVEGVPQFHTITPIEPNKYNIYGMEWTQDYIYMFVNGKEVFKYPRIEEMGENQWAYDTPFFLLLNQILGGWAGEIDETALPAVMEVDWVKYYQPVINTDIWEQ